MAVCSLLLLASLLPAQLLIPRGFRHLIFENQAGTEASRLKGLVTGTQANPNPAGLLVQGMRIELYAPDNSTNLVALAPECTLVQSRGLAYSTNQLEIHAANGQLRVTGEQFHCNLKNTSLTLSNNVRTLIQESLVNSTRGAQPFSPDAPPKPTAAENTRMPGEIVITSSHLWFSSDSNQVVYTREVRVRGDQLDLACERLTIQLGPDNSIQTIVAETNVVITSKEGNGTAHGDHAVYSVSQADEIVTLTGTPVRWIDGPRHGNAARFVFNLTRNTFRAEENAVISLPKNNLAQSSWLLTESPSSSPPQPTADTNATLQISSSVFNVNLPSPDQSGRTITASTNVIITDTSDHSLATSDQATYRESDGTIELTGRASWRSNDRLIQGDRLFFDRTNQVFRADQNAYLGLPLRAISALESPPLNATRLSGPAARSIEIFAENYHYQPGLLEFQDRIWLNLFEGGRLVAQLNSERLLLFLTPRNEVRRIIADRNVTLDNFPPPTETTTTLEERLRCQRLFVNISTNAQIENIIAWKEVVAHQTEQRANSTAPITTRINAHQVTARFFAHTNSVETITAETDVLISQDLRWAQGQKAIYWSTNNLVELSGQPTAESPEGRITNAEVLLWDRTRNRFMVRELRAAGESVPGITNTPALSPTATRTP